MHRVQELIAGCFAGNVEHRIERVKLEVIPVRLPRWRTRTTVAHLFEIVNALACAVGEFIALWEIFCKSAFGRGNVIGDPMNVCSSGSVGVFAEQGKALRFCWSASPSKRRGDVLALTGELLWNGGIVMKSG